MNDRYMEKLPKGFPEYSIMYKALSKKIKQLKLQRDMTDADETKELEMKIQRYESEITKIRKMFPSNFFQETD